MYKRRYKIILLTILVICVFVIAIIELAGISDHSIGWWRDRHQGEASLYDRHNDRYYHGDIYPEETLSRSELVERMQKTTMQFYETKYSFGVVRQGATVKHAFRFKNTGQHPLMIAKSDVSCNCTVSGFPNDAIAPGQEGEITVELNTTGINPSWQEKSVTIHSNAMPESVVIKIDAEIQ